MKKSSKKGESIPRNQLVVIAIMLVVFVLIIFSSVAYYLDVVNISWFRNATDITDISANAAPSCYKWDFNNFNHGQVITNLTSPNVGSLKATTIGVSYGQNVRPNGDYPDPYKVLNVMVLDPYRNNNTPDLRANSGRVLVLNGGKHYRLSDTGNERPVYTESGTFNRDNHDGGYLILTFQNANVTQIRFDTIDMGDEAEQGRINNNYYTVVSQGKTEKVMLTSGANIDVNNKLVDHAPTKNYPQGIQTFTLHFSGSAALDNLEICNQPLLPTLTPPPVDTIEPSPVVTVPPTNILAPTTVTPTVTPTVKPTHSVAPTTAVKSCVQKETRIFYSGEFVAHNASKRNYKLADIQLNEVAKKHDIKVSAYWGWTGAKDQKGSGNDRLVQNNERHNVLVKLLDNQSSATKSASIFCGDLGNTTLYNDGTKPLLKVSLKQAEKLLRKRFLECRKDLRIEQSNGVIDNVRVLNPETKYDRLVVNSVLDYTDASYNACLKANGGNKKSNQKKCAQSHYSRVEVEYCVREQ